MKQNKNLWSCGNFGRFAAGMSVFIFIFAGSSVNAATTPLADTPVRATAKVPANVMLMLSVEWPTAVVQSFNDEVTSICPGRDGNSDSICYVATRDYIGYFDPFKCYNYDSTANYFVPAGYTIGASASLPNAGLKTCAGNWSGNYLNWATMQTIDMFRWAMTGGDRFIDTATLSVLEKARHTGQGGYGQFPIKRLGGSVVGGGANAVTPVAPSTVTPFASANIFSRTQGLNTVMWVSDDRVRLFNNNHPNGNNPNNDLTFPSASFQESGLCSNYSGAYGCTQISTGNPGTRRITVDTTYTNEPGQCASAPPNIACTNTSASVGGSANVERDVTANDAAGLCPANGGTISGTYISCSQITAGQRQVSYRENGVCPATGLPTGATSITCRTRTGSKRDVSYQSPAQCNGMAAAGSQTNFSCSNLSSATRREMRAETGICGSTIPAGYATCTQVVAGSSGTRTATYRTTTDQTGQCDTYAGPGTCSNLTAASGGISVREIAGPMTGVTAYYIRVKVCDQASFAETQSTCTLYGSSYKPTGIMQANSLNMRFGAFAYLFDSDTYRDGGVLRARMKDVGPLKAVPQRPSVTNAASEWNATDGTYINNPDSADAAATNTLPGATSGGSGAINSGVINYLNKFGRTNGYKTYDTLSEMYAEIIKYFKHQGQPSASPTSPTSTYVNNLNSSMTDGFPVITRWNDPIQYSCQQNFVISIGDANTWNDKNLSGGVSNTQNEPSLPADIDPDYNVSAWTNAVGAAEAALVSRIAAPSGSTTYGNDLANLRNCCNGTAFLAGLAYYAHTTDLRADFDNLNGPQTITSFFVDVRESGSWGTSGDPRNQHWLAAKYGGFKDENKNGVFDALDTWADPARGTVQGKPVPKNYFAGNQPEKLVSGLQNAFRDIRAASGAGAGVGVAASNLSQTTGENGIYQVKFDTRDWSGKVSGLTISNIDQTTGAITLVPVFESGALLAAKAAGSGWDNRRVMVTAVPGSTQLGQPFRLANLNAAEQAALGPTVVEQQDVLNYIRGQKSKELTDAAGNAIIGGKYRVRTNLLADIVDSEAVYVGKPSGEYIDQFNPGYSAFKTAKSGRTPAIYVGANDGQLHAFNAVVDRTDTNFANAGQEIMAFVPSLTYAGPNNTPTQDGLRYLTDPTFNGFHKYYVNATPSERDIDFNNTAGNVTTTPDWHSVLVGGLGKGGRGFYALDVTDPANFANEATAATKVLWEFSDEDMGYSFGLPLIVKTRKWGWVVMVSSGYNNTTSSVAANQGQGYLYILNARTGALLQKIGTGVGTVTNPSGFSPISGYTPSFADYTTDEVYGGDLFGNVWRFDLKSVSAPVPAPLLFATLTDASSVVQPITTIPLIEISVSDGKRYVFVGTGRFLDATDIQNAQQQSFYAIRDGTVDMRFETTASTTGVALPTGTTFPITRSVLANNSDLVAGLTTAQITTNPMGWYYNVTGVVNSTVSPFAPVARERINLNPKASQGFVTWVGNVPDANPCNPNGVSSQYATTYGGGKSLLYSRINSSLADVASNRTYQASITTSALVKSQLVNVGDGVRILGTDDSGVPFLIGNPLNSFGAGRLLNWREVLQ